MNNTLSTILCCTVGGSHKPILTALQRIVPDYVIFFCTDSDPVTGRPGSRQQIEGEGRVIRDPPNAPQPTLENLPCLVGLAPDQYEVVLIPSDDLEAAVLTISATFSERLQQPELADATWLADYTGGTKSMSAALVVAALEQPQVALQLVTGARADLVKVADQTEDVAVASVARLQFQRRIDPIMQAWQHYGYGAAAHGLSQLPRSADIRLRQQHNLLLNLSRAFDAWDRFDHTTAHQLLKPYRSVVASDYSPRLITALETLIEPSSKQEPQRLLDLLLNIDRCIVQRRYDDAVSRLYRLLEWSAQWQLRCHHQLDTSSLPDELSLPTSVTLSVNREGKRQAGLYQAWQLLAVLEPEQPAGAFAAEQLATLRGHLQLRNGSILAHGFDPVTERDWQPLAEWFDTAFRPLLLKLCAKAGVRWFGEQMQLPTRPMYR